MPDTLPCPKCGTPVATSGHEFFKGSTRADGTVVPEATEGATCPTCDTPLVRDVMPGEPWRPRQD